MFKKKVVSNNIYAAIFLEKLKPLEEWDTISFYKSKKLRKELLDECLPLYIMPMVDGWEIKVTLVDNGSIANIYSNKILTQIKEKSIQIPPLDEFTFQIWAYDSSSKNPIGIAIIMVTIGVTIIAAKF